jgi:hypothetical protein
VGKAGPPAPRSRVGQSGVGKEHPPRRREPAPSSPLGGKECGIPKGVISVEARWFPVILLRWRGPYTRSVIHDFFVQQRALAERAVRENTYIAVIARVVDPPDAAARKWVAEETERMPPALRARTLRSFCIAENAVHRGVITAVSWLVRDMATLEAVASSREAVRGARALLESRGIVVPADLELEAPRAPVVAL